MITCDIRLPDSISIPLVAHTILESNDIESAICLILSLNVTDGTATITSLESNSDSVVDVVTRIESGKSTPGTDLLLTLPVVNS